MTRVLDRRFVLTGATLLLLAACHADTTSPAEDAPVGGARSTVPASGAAPDDTTRGAPATPASGSSGDTSHPTPPAPPSASAIDLTVYVGLAVAGPDTLRSTPVANARVDVLSRSFTRGSGPDTLAVTETLVASGTTDALGKASFGTLPAAGYRLEAVVDGRPGSRASIQIAPPYPSTVAASIILRPAP